MSAEQYERQALVCINTLLSRLGIKVLLTDPSQVTFDIIHQLACVYFKVEQIPASPAPGGAGPRASGREVSLLHYIQTKLGIATSHISPKGLQESQIFDCMLLLEIVYTMLKGDDMPGFPIMTEKVATEILSFQSVNNPKDLMELQADWIESHERKTADPRGILSAKQILDRYSNARPQQQPSQLLLQQQQQQQGATPQSARTGAAQVFSAPRPVSGSMHQSQTQGHASTPQPQSARSASASASASFAAPARMLSEEHLKNEVCEMVDMYYDKFLRDYVREFFPQKPRRLGGAAGAGAGTGTGMASDVNFEKERIKARLHRLIQTVMQGIHRKEVDYYYKLEARIRDALNKALAVERENLRLEARWKRDELAEKERKERIVKEALEQRLANERQIQAERRQREDAARRINRLAASKEGRAFRMQQENLLFERIARALEQDSGARLKNAVNNFELCDKDIDRIVVERLREYAGAERGIVSGTPGRAPRAGGGGSAGAGAGVEMSRLANPLSAERRQQARDKYLSEDYSQYIEK